MAAQAASVKKGPTCTNVDTDFSKSMKTWHEAYSEKDTWKQTKQGLEMIIIPPKNKTTLHDYKTSNGLPYNVEEGRGPTFNATDYMLYGSFSAVVKSSKVGGTVTAVILIANDGDEIDFELLGGASQTVTSNYFWGKKIVYGKNGREHSVPEKPISQQFYNYTVNWSPEKIDWLIDGKKVRTTTRSSTCQKGDNKKVCRFPSSPARVQLGFWDGSGASGTAEWAHGPIPWKKIKEPVVAYIKRVQIRCNPKYNHVK
ncbi:glycoside hydrolase family 16 protein [Backusella circina FSU 941]|nr:glycoside hydrolase family 16 protein [Backusella circina FSU 941]